LNTLASAVSTGTRSSQILKKSKRPQKGAKSFGPLGDLIRSARSQANLGLVDVAKACRCSVQFISNIEHGRAPLPWDKAQDLARVLAIPFEQLQAANLAIRSDFQSFVTSNTRRVKRASTALHGLKDTASLITLATQDRRLRDLLQQYTQASAATRKRFLDGAKKMLQE
jgi:transcriptional regulator with XRE-family HTH domain